MVTCMREVCRFNMSNDNNTQQVQFSIFDAVTGELLRIGSCRKEDLDIQAQEGEVVREGETPLPPRQIELEEVVRASRNQKLLGSDWTQVADAPVNRELWAEYRQALRDITTQKGFPKNVIWPTPPN